MDDKIDLNQADRDTLAGLPGIGEKLAVRIIEYRETVRPFTAVNELTAIPGISENMVLEIEDQLTVTANPETDAIETVEDPPKEEIPDSPAIPEFIAENNTLEEETITLAAAPELPSNSPPPAPSRSGFKEHLFTAVVGALLGTLLTLAILWLLNGSLQLNETAQMSAFEQQSAQAAATIQAEQTVVRTDLQVAATQIAAVATSESETAGALAKAQTSLESAHNRLADTVDEVAKLETATDGLDKRIAAVAASAENFDAFMVGMRDLLWVLQGPPPTLDATTTVPAPPATATATVTLAVTATAASTPLATRTPRPTATPLGEALPKATPSQ